MWITQSGYDGPSWSAVLLYWWDIEWKVCLCWKGVSTHSREHHIETEWERMEKDWFLQLDTEAVIVDCSSPRAESRRQEGRKRCSQSPTIVTSQRLEVCCAWGSLLWCGVCLMLLCCETPMESTGVQDLMNVCVIMCIQNSSTHVHTEMVRRFTGTTANRRGCIIYNLHASLAAAFVSVRIDVVVVERTTIPSLVQVCFQFPLAFSRHASRKK